MSRLRPGVVPAAGSTFAASFNHRVLGSRAVAHRRCPRQFDGRPGDHPAGGGAGSGSSRRRCVAPHGRGVSRGTSLARRLPRRRDLPRIQCRRNHGHRVVGGNWTDLDQSDVRRDVPHRRRGIGRDADDPRRRRGERGRAELHGRVHHRVHWRRRLSRRVRPRPRDRNAYQRRADGYAGRLPRRPLHPVRRGHRAVGRRADAEPPAAPHRSAPTPAGTEPVGTTPSDAAVATTTG